MNKVTLSYAYFKKQAAAHGYKRFRMGKVTVYLDDKHLLVLQQKADGRGRRKYLDTVVPAWRYMALMSRQEEKFNANTVKIEAIEEITGSLEWLFPQAE